MLIFLVNLLSKYPNHELIIGGNFNGVDEGDSSEEGSIAWFTAESGVIDIHDAFHTAPFPSTYDRGTKRIDQIYVSDRLSSENFFHSSTMGVTTQFSLAITAQSSWILMHGVSLMLSPSPSNRVGHASSGLPALD